MFAIMILLFLGTYAALTLFLVTKSWHAGATLSRRLAAAGLIVFGLWILPVIDWPFKWLGHNYLCTQHAKDYPENLPVKFAGNAIVYGTANISIPVADISIAMASIHRCDINCIRRIKEFNSHYPDGFVDVSISGRTDHLDFSKGDIAYVGGEITGPHRLRVSHNSANCGSFARLKSGYEAANRRAAYQAIYNILEPGECVEVVHTGHFQTTLKAEYKREENGVSRSGLTIRAADGSSHFIVLTGSVFSKGPWLSEFLGLDSSQSCRGQLQIRWPYVDTPA